MKVCARKNGVELSIEGGAQEVMKCMSRGGAAWKAITES